MARIAAMAGLLVLGVVACSESTFDPAATAEQGIRDQIAVELGIGSDVACDAPTGSEVGTTFRCRADAEDGTSYEFVAEILDGEVVATSLDVRPGS